MEIRGDLVAEATANPNLHHMEGNVLEPGWLAALLSSLHAAGCVVRVVAVQFPDPWTAAKHRYAFLLRQSGPLEPLAPFACELGTTFQ